MTLLVGPQRVPIFFDTPAEESYRQGVSVCAGAQSDREYKRRAMVEGLPEAGVLGFMVLGSGFEFFGFCFGVYRVYWDDYGSSLCSRIYVRFYPTKYHNTSTMFVAFPFLV